MKLSIKIMIAILATNSFANIHSMMKESAYNRDEVEALGFKIKNLDLIGYKNIGTTDKQNNFIEKEWQENMQTIAALVNDKELSGLKPMFEKVQKFGNAVLYAAQLMKNFDLMKDKIKTVDTVKKEQSSMKMFMVGQKLKSAFSFGKKEEQYKKLKQLLIDIVDILNNKIESMKKEIEIKKK